MMADGGCDTRIVIQPLRISDVDGSELHVWDVGQANRHVRGALRGRARLRGTGTGCASAQYQRGASCDNGRANDSGKLQGMSPSLRDGVAL